MSQSTREHVQSKVRHHGGARRAMLSVSGLLAVGTIAAACGSTAGSPGTTKPAAGGGGTSAPASTGSSAKTAALVSLTSSGKLGKILVDSKGFTLYRYTKDSMNKTACTGECARVWPPLMMPGSGSPVAGSGVTGLGTISVAGGRQVTYKGMPLYTYIGDKAAGQTHGQGVLGTWFVVTTKSSSTTSTTPPAGGSTSTTGGGGGGIGF